MLCGAGLGVTILFPDLMNRNFLAWAIRARVIRAAPSRGASAPITSALRGWPLARAAIAPSAPSTNTVGVRSTPSARTRSRRDSASISTCATPSVPARPRRPGPPGGPARGAERRRELDQRGPLAQRAAEVGGGQPLRPGCRGRSGRSGAGVARPGRGRHRRAAHPAVAAAPGQPDDGRHGQGRHEHHQSAGHAGVTAAGCQRVRPPSHSRPEPLISAISCCPDQLSGIFSSVWPRR